MGEGVGVGVAYCVRPVTLFFDIVVGVAGMTIPAARGTLLEVSAVRFNSDVEKRANIARGTARALIGSVSALATK